MSGARILALLPDVVLLQECEPAFFHDNVNPMATHLLSKYALFPSYGAAVKSGVADGPGTAVLVLKTIGLEIRSFTTVGGTDDCGGPSKSSSVLEMKDEFGREIAFASTHFTCLSLLF